MTSPVLGCRQKSEGRKEEKKRLAAPAGLQPKWDRCAKVWDRGGDNKPANQRGIYWRDFLHCWTSDKRCHEIPSPLRMYINFKDICAKKKKKLFLQFVNACRHATVEIWWNQPKISVSRRRWNEIKVHATVHFISQTVVKGGEKGYIFHAVKNRINSCCDRNKNRRVYQTSDTSEKVTKTHQPKERKKNLFFFFS